MAGLLMSENWLKDFTESFIIRLDLATLVSPLYYVKSLLIKVLLAYTLLVTPTILWTLGFIN